MPGETLDVYKLLKEAGEFFERGFYKEAEQNCKAALSVNPRLFYAYNILGAIYAKKRGGERQAILYFEKSLSVSVRQPDIYNEIAALYNRTGETDKAISCLEAGQKHISNNFRLNYNLGLMYLINKHDPETAAGFFSNARKQKPDNARVLFITGFSHVLAGDKAQALEYVTGLRALRNENLAAQLEAVMREKEQGKEIDMAGVMEDYAEAKVPGEKKAEKEHETDKNGRITLGEPSIRGSGSGEVIIKRTFKREKSKKDKE